MKILLTGATGFIGQHTLRSLLEQGHEVLAIQRGGNTMPVKHPAVRWILYNIHSTAVIPPALFEVDALIHLAWPGLPNYRETFHYEENLYYSYQFIKTLVEGGLRQVLVTGTCLEYGMKNGPLAEDTVTQPIVAYALAKDTLHSFLLTLQQKVPFVLQWCRLFYMYGAGQSPSSLLPQLEAAICRGDTIFNMSPGDQLRDFLPVEEVARRICTLVTHTSLDGSFNCCSGQPISVRRFVEAHLERLGASLILNLGHYPYPAYEPMAFWGCIEKTERLFTAPENRDCIGTF